MDEMSWVELMGRHAGSATVYLTATMHYSVTQGDGGVVRGTFNFWHGPGQRWRLEANGRVLYVRDGSGAVATRGEDGDMERFEDGHLVMPLLGAGFSPFDLIPPKSLPYKMSVDMRVSRPPQRSTVDDRQTWTTALATPEGVEILVGVDADTGVLVSMTHSDDINFVVHDLVEHKSLDEDLFAWSSH